MKSYPTYTFLALLFFLPGCWLTDRSEEKKEIGSHLINNSQSASSDSEGEKPELVFETESYDFGTISQGEKVTRKFPYRNEGEAPLVIASIEPSCGCTVAEEAPEKPILPGEQDTLTVTFDSKGHSGQQNRSVSVVANTSPKTTVVNIKGMVKAPR